LQYSSLGGVPLQSLELAVHASSDAAPTAEASRDAEARTSRSIAEEPAAAEAEAAAAGTCTAPAAAAAAAGTPAPPLSVPSRLMCPINSAIVHDQVWAVSAGGWYVGLARIVYFIAVYDRIFEEVPAENAVYTLYIYVSGQS
jgi:hypothetical protein